MKIKFDVTTQELAIIRQVLESTLPAHCKVWVFGSRAKNQAKYNSDLDLAIECSDALDKTTLMQLETQFDESRLPYRVDIVDLNKAEPYFKEIVERQKVEFPFKRKVPGLRFPEFQANLNIEKLGDVTKWASGGTPSKETAEYWGGDIPWISASSMYTDYVDSSGLYITLRGLKNGSKLAYKNSILILVRGSMLYNRIPISIASKDVAFNQDVKSLSVDDKVNNKYLFYSLKSAEHRLLSMVVGTGIGAGKLDTPELKALEFFFPEEEEQQKIATFLTTVDKKLNTLRRKHALLGTYKRGLMQKIFSQEVRFKQNDGSDFPDWKNSKLGGLGSFLGGGTPTTAVPEYWQGNIPWISSSDISEESVGRISITRFITELAVKDSATKLVPENSLLIVSRVGIGKMAVARQKVCTSQDFANFTPYKDDPFFLVYLISFQKNRLLSLGQGTSIKGFTNSDLASLAILLPSVNEQQKIANCLTSFDQKIDAVAQQITQLEAFKQGLLQKMFV